MMVCCPFAPKTHKSGRDRNPSMGISIDNEGRSGYHCFSCKKKGNIQDLVLGVEWARDLPLGSYSAIMAQAVVEDRLHRPAPFDASSVVDEEPEPLPLHIYGDLYDKAWDIMEAREYLVGRGVTRHVAELMDLRFDDTEERIVFPIYDADKNLYGFTGRLIYDHEYRTKVRNYDGIKKEKFLLGEHLIDPTKPFLVVEGLFGVLHCLSLGLDDSYNVVGTMGSSMSKTQAGILIDFGNPVYLMYDDDMAGDQGLFGTYDETRNKYAGGGAVDLLKDEVPTYVVPFLTNLEDIDHANRRQMERMLANAEVQQGFNNPLKKYDR